MLDNPVMEGAVNTEAARMYVKSPRIYSQTVLECVLASKRVDGKTLTSCKEILNP